MYHSDRYPTSLEEAETFVATQRHGYLIATPPGGHPQVSILPFVKQGDDIELHCVQEDPTFAAVRANPLATFFVADFLAFSRHDWVDPNDGARATLNFRAVAYHCRAETSTAPGDVAAALARLLTAYEPGATYEPIAAGDFYGPRIERLAAVYLHVLSTDAKFKVGRASAASAAPPAPPPSSGRSSPACASATSRVTPAPPM
jgi:hypothetical protein